MFRLEGARCSDSSTSRSCLRSRSRPGTRRASPAPEAVPVDRFVGIGLVRPVTVRPVAGVWDSVDSRPVPPARFFVAALAFLRVGFLGVGFLGVSLALGRLALEVAGRRFGADALL